MTEKRVIKSDISLQEMRKINAEFLALPEGKAKRDFLDSLELVSFDSRFKINQDVQRWFDKLKNKDCGEDTTKNRDFKEIPMPIMDILKSPSLFEDIIKEMDKKIVGEYESRKAIFLCCQGRNVLNHQTASYNLLINDEAGAGKDYITGAILELIPKESYIHKTRISPTVFTYWHNPKFEPEWTWDGKVFYPEDISETVLNSDVFKVMSSKGSSATIVIKQQAIEINIRGKPVIITTTATATPNPELVRRFGILNLDSSENQTKAIMKRHSEFKKSGIVPEYDENLIEAQKYLKRVKVKIPFADLIDEFFPSKNIIMRTNYPRFLDFISASASFFQYQREKDINDFILADSKDYNLAREVFLKLCSNKYMIPLTINQKKILESFEKEPFLKASASQLHASKMSFINLSNLQINLQTLVKYGILETAISKDNYGRDLEVYSLSKSYNPNEKLEIPTFEEIMQKYNSINNINSINSAITSIISRDGIDTIDIIAKIGKNNEQKEPEEDKIEVIKIK